MRFKPLLSLFPLLLCPSLAAADLIVGQVVDSNGVGVPGVDIDVKNLGSGGSPTPFNDGTDANGFFSTTIPAGFYRITFTPPPPPTTTHLITEVCDVTVIGTTSMGVISLPPGVSLTTRVVDSAGFPVANVNADIIDLATGDNINLAADTSDAFGQLSIAVPAGPIEFRLKTAGVIGATLAPFATQLSPMTNTNLGDTTLAPGFTVSGHLQSTSGIPVEGVDLDFRDPLTGTKLFTPGDNSDPLGNFAVVVPGGTWDVEFCPFPFTQLVPQRVANTVTTTNVALGTIVLPTGVTLFGTIRDFLGAPRPGARIDLEIPFTNTHLLLCGGRADSGGNYSVVVPTGSFDVTFSPVGFSQPLGEHKLPALAIGGTMRLDGVLPECPFSSAYGAGSPGTGGVVPVLTSLGGAPRASNGAWAWSLDNGLGGGTAILLVSLRKASIPLFGHTMLVNPTPPRLMRTVVLDGAPGVPGAGSATFGFPGALSPALLGVPFYAQFAVLDSSPFGNVSLSNGLTTTFCN